MPKFLKRKHPADTTSQRRADIKRQLTWQALRIILAPLAIETVSDTGYTYVCCALLSGAVMRAVRSFWCYSAF